ncbi:structure-specific endonuclease subunit SLX4 isoform X3 [Solea solea]|uniref:structure-specific endonuclease subunit SLX4 isoform X3 n=1 Tax=Solea solea TaxID=90069 RepID=UPI00272A50AD|nr:structure-specific endonuclease subunit SLX4 isoform X3 [Solea solea]
MDDSDQDFVDLCSKLLKRVRRKPGESRPPKSAEHQPSTQTSEGDKRRKKNKKDGDSGSKVTGTQSVFTGTGQHAASGETGGDSRDAGPLAAATSSTTTAAEPRFERGLSAKDKVLLKMQQFKKTSPPRMTHRDTRQQMNLDGPQPQRQDSPEPCSSGLHINSDEALALRLQQELDREEAQAEMVDLEDGGLFFCQICYRDLSHMTPEGRTQHLNRCLDDSENSGLIPPPPLVPDCPICGKTFKSQKSRSTHLKRCSSEMGVPPAVLLQALQRQAKETPNVPTVNTVAQTAGTKRKGPSKPGLPVKKKPRKKADPVDEDTMVALALSSSLLEQEKEAHRELNTKPAVSHTAVTTALKGRPDGAAKGRGKKKRGVVPRPPPILLVQDAEVALVRLQERVSALLLRNRMPSPPTPTRCPSRLCGLNSVASLWQKSALLNSNSTALSDFYTTDLRELITPWETAKTNEASCSAGNKPESSLQPESEGTPVTGSRASILPSSTHTATSTPETGQRLVGSQALRDLMELAEDGMTLTQCRYPASGHAKDKRSSTSQSTNLHLSGFVLEEEEEEEEKADLCLSDFLTKTAQGGDKGDKKRGSHQSVAVSRLSSDLNSMVNNPQLSDVQLQVDSGEVYFAHSFMVYARCPLLAEMVHESGFGVQEEGVPAAQRVLMSDVPGQAVFALLQYLYTAHCSIPSSLRPHVQELASRFDLQELHQLCELHGEEAPPQGDKADYANQGEDVNDQTDQAFMELLRSMWNDEEEDEEDEGTDSDGGKDEERVLEDNRQTGDVTSGERELCEEQVNEEELEEIYNFAATQRKRVEENDSIEEEEEKKLADEEDSFTKLTESQRGISKTPLYPNSKLESHPSQDSSYNRVFSESFGVYEEENISPGPSKTQTSQPQKQLSSCKPLGELPVRTLLQFSPSIVDDFSPSPPPSTSNLPVAGVSPAQVGDYGGGGGGETDAVEVDVPKECRSLKRESRGSCGICVPASPDSGLKKKEPELIVLSDSSDEMEVDVAVLSSHSPHSSCAKLQTFTQIRPQSISKPSETIMENKVSSSIELSSNDPPDGRPGLGCDQSPVDCSLEVSWLIPSTPVHPGRCTKSSSTQTKSSTCRTQLFPKGGISSPSSVFSSPALPSHYSLHNSSSGTRVSSKTGPTEGSIPRLNLEETVPCSSGLDPNLSSKSASGFGVNKNREMSSMPQHQHKPHPLSASLKQDTPQHAQPQPYSSTPLHTELQQPPVLPGTSPLTSSLDKQRMISQGRDRASSESLEKTELGSFHLSPLSNPSDPPSPLSYNKGLHCPQKHNNSSSDSRCPEESSSRTNTGAELKRRGGDEEGKGERECKNRDTHDESEGGGEPGVVESSFQQSFMDEPPIAFNDSWGLDAYAGADPGCFSLRLEDSGGSSQQEHSLGRGEAAKSSSSDCQPAPSFHHIQSGKSCSSVVQSSASKSHCAQPPASVQAQRKPSLTPSPPEINNSLMDPKIWDSWEEEDEEVLPLNQRVNPSAQFRTPASHNKKRRSVVPITPMPHYSDMDTPELKNKLNSFGVRPLPKRQMVLKLREIHQYTHQVVSSDSDGEAPSARRTLQVKPPPKTSSAATGSKSGSCSQTVTFKEPRAPAAVSPLKHRGEEEEKEGEPLSASQGSNTSSTAASEESERSNPEFCPSTDGDSDSDGGISASQAATRHQDRLQAVRAFILSDSTLYSQILQYQPLVLSQLQGRLKAAGIRLGAAKLVDYLDSQCITFTTAKPGHSAPSRRRGKRTKATVVRGANGKKAVSVPL